MKLTDILKEHYESDRKATESELKKANLVYKLHQKGEKLFKFDFDDTVDIMMAYKFSDGKEVWSNLDWSSDNKWDLTINPDHIDLYVEDNPYLVDKSEEEKRLFTLMMGKYLNNLFKRYLIDIIIFTDDDFDEGEEPQVTIHYISFGRENEYKEPKGNYPYPA